ncbi:MAG: hypothetical protein M3R15_13600, partial [Acidobacteriota bacterium]|nr:hypothetical protein [Acidobacteriota bacterium]
AAPRRARTLVCLPDTLLPFGVELIHNCCSVKRIMDETGWLAPPRGVMLSCLLVKQTKTLNIEHRNASYV